MNAHPRARPCLQACWRLVQWTPLLRATLCLILWPCWWARPFLGKSLPSSLRMDWTSSFRFLTVFAFQTLFFFGRCAAQRPKASLPPASPDRVFFFPPPPPIGPLLTCRCWESAGRQPLSSRPQKRSFLSVWLYLFSVRPPRSGLIL